ncbi:MAG TPA: tetratricopeptide repeat protein, partial [Pyrinomonadaceae bacterium]|nr:tetratricopeptide repeat protein [Pyrinomonadaceae bacterium]
AGNVELGVPDSIRQMIEKQVDHLDAADQRLLEAASVAGLEFSSLAVVAALEEDRATVEARCDELVRRHHFLQDCGVHELPNGEAVSRYGFIHALYQNVLYDRTSPSRRVQLHRRIAERGEEVYGDRAGDIAAELAMHFERARDYKRTAKYLQRAADKAIRRFAYEEAVPLARRGLETLARMPDSSERAEQELCLQLTLGVPLIATEGYAAEDVGKVYVRARELCRQIGDTPDVSEALWGLWTFHTLKAELSTALDIAEEFLSLAERLPYHGLALRGHWALEIVFFHQGEFEKAIEHCEKALSLYEPKRHVDDAYLYALNPGVAVPCFAGWALWFLGHPDQAPARIEEALTVARQLSEPQCLAHALSFAAFLYQLRRDERRAQEYAEATIDVARVHGLVMYEAMASIIRAWALFEQHRTDEAIEQMSQGLAALEETNTDLVRPQFLALLAEALGKTGRTDEGLKLMDQALELVDRKGERYYHAELYRLKGELLLLQSGDVSSAEDCFRQAIKIAQEQKAKSWELRAAMSLARLYVRQNDEKQALDLLAPVYDSFSEGFDTLDLREAKALLRALSNSDSRGQPA